MKTFEDLVVIQPNTVGQRNNESESYHWKLMLSISESYAGIYCHIYSDNGNWRQHTSSKSNLTVIEE